MIDLNTIIGPLIGAAAGVVLGGICNGHQRKKLANNRKLFFRNLLLHEIRKSIDLLDQRKVNLIPVDAWDSLVNSGDTALFSEVAIDLSDVYFQIQNYNYEAKRVRDAVEAEILHLRYRTTNDDGQVSETPEGVQTYRSSELKHYLEGTIFSLLEKLKTIEKTLNSEIGRGRSFRSG